MRPIILVSMPWASASRPSIALGLLAAIARRHGFPCSARYLNLPFAARFDPPDLYEHFANSPKMFPLAEHLFAVDLFGPRELDSDAFLDDLYRSATDEARTDETSTGAAQANPPGCNPLRRLRDELVPEFLEQCADSLLGDRPAVVGFSCSCAQLLPSLALARRLKQRSPEITIIVGGSAVHDPMGAALAPLFCDGVDHFFTGEAEDAFVSLLAAKRDGRPLTEIPGITVNGQLTAPAAATASLEHLPAPDYDDYFVERHALEAQDKQLPRFLELPFESSRGCWWGQKNHCTFCGVNNSNIRYRTKSPQRSVAEIAALSAKHDCLSFIATDCILDYRAPKGLFPRVSELGVDLSLFYEVKTNLSRDGIRAMADGGVRAVQPGIESFSDNVLRIMRKGTTALRNVQLLKWLTEYDIAPIYNLLTGFEGERDEDFDQIARIIAAISHLPPPSCPAYVITLQRYSPMFHATVDKQAAPFYQHLFPARLCPAEAYAYYFQYAPGPDAPVSRRLPELNALIATWKENRRRVRARRGAGFIEIESESGDGPSRRALTTEESLVFVLADSAIRIRDLIQRATATRPAPAERYRAAVDRLTQQKLMLQDHNRTLSVVPFSRGLAKDDLNHWLGACC